jgi:myo-inositol-1(or 4)-monophosphatase
LQEAEADTTAADRADLDLIREAAAEAGRIALRYFGKAPEVWMKEGQSPVSEADFAVDEFLRQTLLAARPEYGWLSEESVDSPERLSAHRTFVVDPIDGTRAFIDGRPTWCVSIGVVEKGRSVAGVLDCPAKREVFAAVRGQGATQDGQGIHVSRNHVRPAVGGPKPMIQALDEADRRAIRTVGYVPSLAYRVAMVARGEIDATFVRANSHDWDLAAADLILEEAGGQVLTPDAVSPAYATVDPRHGPLAAGSGPLLLKMAQVLKHFR